MLQLKTSHMTQPKRIPHATTKTQHSQINKSRLEYIKNSLLQFNNSKDKKKKKKKTMEKMGKGSGHVFLQRRYTYGQ